MAREVIHHAHHRDEGVYRLVHAEVIETVVHELEPEEPEYETRMVPNPDFETQAIVFEQDQGDPSMFPPGLRFEGPEIPMMIEETVQINVGKLRQVERIERFHVDHQDVVWDADDPKWKGRELEDIATEQRAAVREAIAQRLEEERSQLAASEAARIDLGGLGTEL